MNDTKDPRCEEGARVKLVREPEKGVHATGTFDHEGKTGTVHFCAGLFLSVIFDDGGSDGGYHYTQFDLVEEAVIPKTLDDLAVGDFVEITHRSEWGGWVTANMDQAIGCVGRITYLDSESVKIPTAHITNISGDPNHPGNNYYYPLSVLRKVEPVVEVDKTGEPTSEEDDYDFSPPTTPPVSDDDIAGLFAGPDSPPDESTAVSDYDSGRVTDWDHFYDPNGEGYCFYLAINGDTWRIADEGGPKLRYVGPADGVQPQITVDCGVRSIIIPREQLFDYTPDEERGDPSTDQTEHPDTARLRGVQQVLDGALRSVQAARQSYTGIDIILDACIQRIGTARTLTGVDDPHGVGGGQ